MGRGKGSGIRRFDLFTKIEDDLLKDSTLLGTILSVLALTAMVVLMVIETSAFIENEYKSTISMNENFDSAMLKINFNITMHDLSCDYATVDLYDVLGTNRQNITSTVEKWQLDSEGNKRMYKGKNRGQREFEHDNHLHPSLEELHSNGVHADELTVESFTDFVTENEFTFVDFYAPWCVWCQRLAPTWEKFAEDVDEQGLQLKVAKVNCVTQPDICRAQKIMAFPTMRFLKNGEAVNAGDFRSDRTTQALMEFVTRKLDLEDQYKRWPEARKAHAKNWNPDHPGCMLAGYLVVKNVPGNFHIEARSVNHNFHAEMTNLSHTVNHMSFGRELTTDQVRRIERAGASLPHSFSPLDDAEYVVEEIHRAYHHYLKVVNTKYILGSTRRNRFTALQFLGTHQIMKYGESDVPEAKFHYDISPMSVQISKEGRRWYDFLTSLLSLLGGTFTVIGLIEGFLYGLLKEKKE